MSNNKETITLVVDGNEFHCDKDLLVAESDYFQAMFSSGMRESKLNRIELQTVSSRSMEMLTNCFDNGFSLNLKNVAMETIFDLITTTCMLQITRITQQCEYFLVENIDIENCLQCLQLSKLHHLNSLHTMSMKFSLWHFIDIYKEHLDHILELPQDLFAMYISNKTLHVESEMQVFECIIQWIKHDLISREEKLPEMLECMHFADFDDIDFDKMLQTDLIKQNQESLNLITNQMKNCTEREEQSTGIKTKARQVPHEIICAHKFTVNNSINLPNNEDPSSNECPTNNKGPSRLILHTMTLQKASDSYVLEQNFANGEENGPLFSEGFQLSVIGKFLYVTGGELNIGRGKWAMDVWRYNSLSGEWRVVTSLPGDPRRHHCAVVLESNIYLIGGYSRFRVIVDSVERYNTKTDQWFKCAPLLDSVIAGTATSCDGKIYTFKNCIQCYEPTLDYWTKIRTNECLPFQYGLTHAVSEGHVIIVSMRAEPTKLLIFDTRTNQWHLTNVSRKHSVLQIKDGKVYFLPEQSKIVNTCSVNTFSEGSHVLPIPGQCGTESSEMVTLPIYKDFI